MIGFSFGAGGRASGVAVYDPTVLALTGWWRASYSASPWSGTASAGSSGSNNLTEATNPPSAGTAVNGLTPADFDGVNDQLRADGTLNTYAAPTAFSGWALIYADAVPKNVYVDTATAVNLIADTGAATLYIDAYATSVTRAMSLSTWSLVTWRYNGTNVQVGVNEAPGAAGGGATAAYSASLTLTGSFDFMNFDGKILDIGLSDTSLTDQNFTDIKSYINSRYGLAL